MPCMRYLVYAMFACACGAPVEQDRDLPAGMTFFTSDDPVLLTTAEKMTEHVALVTGRFDVRVAADGIPLRWQEGLTSADGLQPACAETILHFYEDDRLPAAQEILFDPTPEPGCASLDTQAMHESIHALYPKALHTDRGVFALKAQTTNLFDTAALVELCSGFNCVTMSPEAP